MTTFTGYEPKARGIRASGQIVPDDNLAQDLSMVSSLEDFLEETIALLHPCTWSERHESARGLFAK